MQSARPARVSDAIAIADVHIASWRAGYADILPNKVLDEILDRKALQERWSRILVNPDPPGSSAFVICVDEAVVGWSRFGAPRDMDSILDGDTGEIYGFYLHPSRWGRGLGRALMEAVIEELAGRGYVQATLNVIEANERARVFYERQGWVSDKAAAPWHGQSQVRYRKEL